MAQTIKCWCTERLHNGRRHPPQIEFPLILQASVSHVDRVECSRACRVRSRGSSLPLPFDLSRYYYYRIVPPLVCPTRWFQTTAAREHPPAFTPSPYQCPATFILFP